MSPTANLRFNQQGFTLDPTGAAAPVPCSGAVAPETPLLMLIPKRLRLANGRKRRLFLNNGRERGSPPLKPGVGFAALTLLIASGWLISRGRERYRVREAE